MRERKWKAKPAAPADARMKTPEMDESEADRVIRDLTAHLHRRTVQIDRQLQTLRHHQEKGSQ